MKSRFKVHVAWKLTKAKIDLLDRSKSMLVFVRRVRS
jgi:hypothetical protein